jgi:hypothetical protein
MQNSEIIPAHNSAQTSQTDSELMIFIEVWPRLPEHIREKILDLTQPYSERANILKLLA